MNNHNFVHLKSSYTDVDSRWMKVAINYGLRNVGFTGKNPCVGCVIVRNNELCGFGVTSPGGRPHAEENALKFADWVNNNVDSDFLNLKNANHHFL